MIRRYITIVYLMRNSMVYLFILGYLLFKIILSLSGLPTGFPLVLDILRNAQVSI